MSSNDMLSYIIASGDLMDECNIVILGNSRQELETTLCNIDLSEMYEINIYHGIILKGQVILNNPEKLDVFWLYITDAEKSTGFIGNVVGQTPIEIAASIKQLVELSEEYGIDEFDIDNLKLIYGYKVNCQLTIKNDYLNKFGAKACLKFASSINGED